MRKKFYDEYPLMLKYRTHIMAVSIVWVVFFHSNIPVQESWIAFLKNWGYGGVDSFFFLSGMGLYYSLKKNSIEEFYKRRMKRILPSYLPFIIVWFLSRQFISVYVSQTPVDRSFWGQLTIIREFLGNVTTVGWFAGLDNQFNWYISMLILLYLAAPAIYAFVKYISEKKGRYIIYAILLLSICVTYMQTIFLMGISRVIIFTLGMLVAHLMSSNEEGKIPVWLVYVLMLTGGVWLYISFTYYSGYLGLLGLYWFPFVLITPGLCMLEAKVFSIIDKNIFGKKVIPLVEKIGAASFEIYLVHIAMFSLVVNVYFLNTAMLWKLWIPLAVIGGIIYKLMIEFCKKILKKRSRI